MPEADSVDKFYQDYHVNLIALFGVVIVVYIAIFSLFNNVAVNTPEAKPFIALVEIFLWILFLIILFLNIKYFSKFEFSFNDLLYKLFGSDKPDVEIHIHKPKLPDASSNRVNPPVSAPAVSAPAVTNTNTQGYAVRDGVGNPITDISGSTIYSATGATIYDVSGSYILDVSGSYIQDTAGNRIRDVSGVYIRDVSGSSFLDFFRPTQGSTNTNTVKTVDVPSKSCKQEELGEVFHIPHNRYTYEQARETCELFDARLATYDEIEDSYKNGANWCSYGWSSDQLALFPIQKSMYNELKRIPGHERDCGRTGVNGGYMQNRNSKFGVNCYGKKPFAGEDDLAYMKKFNFGKAFPHLEAKKKEREDKMNKILIAPFNKDKWNED